MENGQRRKSVKRKRKTDRSGKRRETGVSSPTQPIEDAPDSSEADSDVPEKV